MELTRGERYLRMIKSVTKSRPKEFQEAFFRQEIERVTANADFHKLSKEDIEFLKNAQFEGQK